MRLRRRGCGLGAGQIGTLLAGWLLVSGGNWDARSGGMRSMRSLLLGGRNCRVGSLRLCRRTRLSLLGPARHRRGCSFWVRCLLARTAVGCGVDRGHTLPSSHLVVVAGVSRRWFVGCGVGRRLRSVCWVLESLRGCMSINLPIASQSGTFQVLRDMYLRLDTFV